MKSQSSALIELPAIASSSVENAADAVEQKLNRPKSVQLEAFPVRLAWAFASVVFLLIVVSLLLVVAGYAGSMFGSDLQPKSVSSSLER
jgi:hypothetical protein